MCILLGQMFGFKKDIWTYIVITFYFNIVHLCNFGGWNQWRFLLFHQIVISNLWSFFFSLVLLPRARCSHPLYICYTLIPLVFLSVVSFLYFVSCVCFFFIDLDETPSIMHYFAHLRWTRCTMKYGCSEMEMGGINRKRSANWICW